MDLSKRVKEVVVSRSEWEKLESEMGYLQTQNKALNKDNDRKHQVLDALKEAGIVIDPSVLHGGPYEMVVQEKTEDGDIVRVIVRARV